MSRLATLAIVFLLAGPVHAADRSVLFLTLDTTRADVIGAYGGKARTPNLDALARTGMRYQRAIATAPITAPSHASLLTGRYPHEVGVISNGVDALPSDVPTLATFFQARKYATAAFVSSRVLDRRFGFSRGFDSYDDAMIAEQLGEYGYPERDANQVADAAIAWISGHPKQKFVWVHFYDPHSPYEAPGSTGSEQARYQAEVERMDAQLGRVIAEFRKSSPDGLIVAVGDHGESLGEHGEDTHGIFLYDSVLRVPLIISGGGVEQKVISTRVSARAVAATVAKLATGKAVAAFGTPLPESSTAVASNDYALTELPKTAYGWTPIEMWSDGRWKLVSAPKVELYDLRNDPDEQTDVSDAQRRTVSKLRAELTAFKRRTPRRASTIASDPQVTATLRSLGYVSGSKAIGPEIDPKDGMKLLAEYQRARALAGEGKPLEAAEILQPVVRQNPGNVVFLTELGRVLVQARRFDEGLAAYRSAVALNPELDLLHFNLGDALLASGNIDGAQKEFAAALELNPRSAAAAIRLAEIEIKRKNVAAARGIFRRAVESGAHSASILTRHAELEANAGNAAAARELASRATQIAPQWARAWFVLAGIATDIKSREQFLRRAVAADPYDELALLELGRAYAASGKKSEAKATLQRCIQVARGSATIAEAKALLDSLN